MVQKHSNIEVIEDMTLTYLENEDNYLMADIIDNEIVGFLLAYTLQRCDGKNAMIYVHEVNVLSEHRKKGVGGSLLNALKVICKEKNIMKIFLLTNKSNEPAVKLYESVGGVFSETDDVLYVFNKETFNG